MIGGMDMEYVEFSGKTVDDALTNALVALEQPAIRLSMRLWKREAADFWDLPRRML